MFTQTTEPILVPIQPTPASRNKVFALKQARIEPMLTDIDSLPDIMYGDLPEEDVFEMFTTSTKTMKPLQHPLANKSIFPLPGMHIPIETSSYVTIVLSSSHTLAPHMTELSKPPEEVTEQTPVTISEYFSDFFFNSYERTTQPSSYERPSPKPLRNQMRHKDNEQSSETQSESNNTSDNYLEERDLSKYF